METQQLAALAALLRSQRQAALGTLRDGAPFVSMVLYAEAPDLSGFWLHLSSLAVHTRALRQASGASLMIFEPDTGSRDPQQLARVSLQGEASVVGKGTPDYEVAKTIYLAKYPGAVQYFNLGDFDLYCLQPQTARYVAGFAQAYNLTTADLLQAGQL